MENTTEWTLNLLENAVGLDPERISEVARLHLLTRGKQSQRMLDHLRAISAEGPLPTRWGLLLLAMALSLQGRRTLLFKSRQRLERSVVHQREEIILGCWSKNDPASVFALHREDIKRRCEQRRLIANTIAFQNVELTREDRPEGSQGSALPGYLRRRQQRARQSSLRALC
jgi:hypothetical protein